MSEESPLILIQGSDPEVRESAEVYTSVFRNRVFQESVSSLFVFTVGREKREIPIPNISSLRYLSRRILELNYRTAENDFATSMVFGSAGDLKSFCDTLKSLKPDLVIDTESKDRAVTEEMTEQQRVLAQGYFALVAVLILIFVILKIVFMLSPKGSH